MIGETGAKVFEGDYCFCMLWSTDDNSNIDSPSHPGYWLYQLSYRIGEKKISCFLIFSYPFYTFRAGWDMIGMNTHISKREVAKSL